MSKLIFGNRKIVSHTKEVAGGPDYVLHTFIEAYEELRRVCPRGDIMIYLSVEVDRAEDFGAVFEERLPDGRPLR